MIENDTPQTPAPNPASDATPDATPPRRRLRAVSPVGMVIASALIAGGFGVCHLLGLREDVGVLFATSEIGSISRVLGAAAYVLLYLGAIIACPILLLAGAIFAVIERGLRGA
jgi:hypothetical protein